MLNQKDQTVDELLAFAKERKPQLWSRTIVELDKTLKKVGKNYESEKEKTLTKAILKSMITRMWR